jgi:uncharacterized protein YheU (UPF0270 family)
MDERDPPPDPVEIPPQALSPEALRGIVENFVLREGTEYGEHDVSLDRKVADVMRQIERREARIYFDPETESVTLVRA